MDYTNEYNIIYSYIEAFYNMNKITTFPYYIYNTSKEKNFKNNIEIIKLLKSDYVIFLTDKFFNWYNKLLLKYFKKYNIIFFKYNDREEILNTLEVINYYIKHESFIKKNILKEKFKIKNLKSLYFLENNIEPHILYKKISFSQEEIFLSFDNYIIKKMEYKLRTFCQIAEKLGAEIIKIKYDYVNESTKDINVGMNLSSFDLEAATKESKKTEENIGLTFRYSNINHNMNINKFYINRLIEKESEFFISKEEFAADIDLKFLINSRCINLIQLYNTSIIINNVNKLEEKICAKASNYGLNIGKSSSNAEYININISVKFNNIYSNPECINGGNIYVKKEGFFHLQNIIKEQINIYKKNNTYTYEKEIELYAKIVRFFKSHLRYIDRKTILIEEYTNIYSDTIIIYENIFNPSFYKEEEIHKLLYYFFKDNMYFSTFEKFRNILINIINPMELMFTNISIDINKYYFLCLQYNTIVANNKKIIDNLNVYFDRSYEGMTKITFKSFTIALETDKELLEIIGEAITIQDLVYILDSNKKQLKVAIVDAYKKSYIEWNGLYTIYNKRLYEETIIVIHSNFEFTFQNIITKIISKIISRITEINHHSNNNNNNNKIASNIVKYIISNIIYEMNKIIEKDIIINNSGYMIKIISNILLSYFISTYDVNFLSIFSGFFKLNSIKTIDNIIQEITKIIDYNICIINYNNYKLYYTWANFLTIIDYFETKIIKEQYVLKKKTEAEIKEKLDIIDMIDKDNIDRIEIERNIRIKEEENKKNIYEDNKSKKEEINIQNKEINIQKKEITKKKGINKYPRIKNPNFFNNLLSPSKKKISSSILQKMTKKLNDTNIEI